MIVIITMQGSRRAKTCWLSYIISPVLIKVGTKKFYVYLYM
nr:MAG TPA: hypothetical protein [Caudoviricetes sp.]